MWLKAEWMGRPMRLELPRVGLLTVTTPKVSTVYLNNTCNILETDFINKNLQISDEGERTRHKLLIISLEE